VVLSADRSRTPIALGLLFLCNLAAGWGCAQPNPAYESHSNDASLMDDVTRPLDATPDTSADAVPSSVEPPSTDGAGPADSPLDASVERDTGLEARSDVATDTAGGGTADVLQQPGLMLDKSVYNLEEEIAASFSNGPGNAADWIGIYDESAPAPSDDNRSLLWYYTDNQGWDTRGPGPGPRNGTVVFGPGSRGQRRWPLPAGRYKAIFLSNPHIVLAAPAHFQVR